MYKQNFPVDFLTDRNSWLIFSKAHATQWKRQRLYEAAGSVMEPRSRHGLDTPWFAPPPTNVRLWQSRRLTPGCESTHSCINASKRDSFPNFYCYNCSAAVLCGPPVAAQSGASPAESSGVSEEVIRVVELGQTLEEEGRWLEALSHYDAAIRTFPEDQPLRLRRTLAHIHVDLDRRMADYSFLRFVNESSRQQVESLFQEICLKVQTHYVHEPNWQRLAWRGTANLDVAVTQAEFRRRFAPRATDQQIADFRNFLRSNVNKRGVETRGDAGDLASYTADLASQQLGIPAIVALGEYCAGAVASLDQYSTYLTADQLDDVYNQIEGNFVGLGIELKATNDALLIVKVIPGGPADEAGIRAGNRIVAVDGHSTSDISTDKAAEMLKGDQGSVVVVQLATAQGEREVRVRRERVDVPCVEDVGIIDREYGIGYFRLTSFQKTTSRDVDQALWKLHRDGMRSIIIDVRGNPGGLLTASVEVADKFVQEGTIVSTRGRSPREDFDYKAHRVGTWRVPLIVLIDGDTASASEIFAGAIRDHGRGQVLGERSFGKGSVQGIFPLGISKSGVRLTTAKFYSPNGNPISERGVEPHHTIHMTAKPNIDGIYQTGLPSEDEDLVVAAACEAVRRLAVANR